MEFYVIIVPPLIFSLLMILQLLKMGRRDRRLFAEHQKLYKLMEPIRYYNFSLSKKDYARFRHQIDSPLTPLYMQAALRRSQDESEDAVSLTTPSFAHRTNTPNF